jgi:hypothetical protein
MSYGQAETDSGYPRAHAVCDRCGRRTNHYKLNWQYDWRGPRLQNLRFLVCDSCYDTPQQSGQRTILIPADPIPVMNPRPEYYVPDSNPLSGIGASPNTSRQQAGSQLGTMTDAGGITSAFNTAKNKPDFQCAMIATSLSSFQNWVGVNWSADTGITASNLDPPVLTHTVTSFTLTAPNNATFGSTAYVIQCSQIGNNTFGSWTTIASGNPAGTIGEVISGPTTGGQRSQFHRAAFWGNGGSAIAVAQVSFNVSDGSSNAS